MCLDTWPFPTLRSLSFSGLLCIVFSVHKDCEKSAEYKSPLKIKVSFKEQRSRRRAPIKMMKIFNFYFGILVRTSVYTNTDCMVLSVWGLFCFCFYIFYVSIMSAFQNSTRWGSAKGLQSRAPQAEDHTELDFTPRRTHNEWLQWGVRSKHGKRILTHG